MLHLNTLDCVITKYFVPANEQAANDITGPALFALIEDN